jgi:hypothetical protein
MPHNSSDSPEPNEEQTDEKPLLSYRGAMAAYAVLGALCAATLHGDPLYICLLIIGALAFKTWLARAKSRLK